MKISDEISLSARNLLRRKGRTALTVVGVVVGICAVIVMISMGIAESHNNDEMLKNMGGLTKIEVYNYGSQNINGQEVKLDNEAVQRFRKIDPNVKSHRETLINTFVNAVYLYDEKVLITFNYKDGTKTITFDEIAAKDAPEGNGSDLGCFAPPNSSYSNPILYEKGFGYVFCLSEVLRKDYSER